MKEFNLEDALNGKKVITRTGLEVTQLHLFSCYSYFCLYGVIDGVLFKYSRKGNKAQFKDSDYDLFMDTEKKEAWINIYKDPSMSIHTHDTKEQALLIAEQITEKEYISTIKIEWEE